MSAATHHADPARAAADALLARLLHPSMMVEHVFSGGGRCMSSAIRSLLPGKRLVGRALTVRTHPGFTRRPIEALDRAQPGDVLVMAAGGESELSCWGGVVHWHAALKGVSGVVIDGPTRDLLEIRRHDAAIPLFARGQAPAIAGFGATDVGAIGAPIFCGGVEVRTGDLVYGDDNGVAVVPWQQAEQVVTLALKSIAFDEKEIRWVQSGRSVLALIEMLWGKDGSAYKERKFRWADTASLDDLP